MLLTGGGQYYAGKPWKGTALLLAGVGSLVAAAGTSCAYNYYSTCDNGPSTAFLIGGLSMWVYSMASAPHDARDYNTKHSGNTAMRPVIEHREGRTGLGLALAF